MIASIPTLISNCLYICPTGPNTIANNMNLIVHSIVCPTDPDSVEPTQAKRHFKAFFICPSGPGQDDLERVGPIYFSIIATVVRLV